MQYYEIDGEKYYLIKGKIYDSSFLEPDKMTLEKVAPIVLREAYGADNMEWEDTLQYIKTAKACEQYAAGIKACITGLQKFGQNEYFVDMTLPILTSMYRLIGKPQLAIDAAEEYVRKLDVSYSVALLTSVAAAYCDLGDYASAKKFADLAYATQGGGKGEKTELSLVYARIRKLSAGEF